MNQFIIVKWNTQLRGFFFVALEVAHGSSSATWRKAAVAVQLWSLTNSRVVQNKFGGYRQQIVPADFFGVWQVLKDGFKQNSRIAGC
jgi:hypothetical protein